MQYGFKDAISKVGLHKFLSDLFWIGMFYHLYNQVCNRHSLFNCFLNQKAQGIILFDIC